MFSCFVRFLVKKIDINSEKCIEYDDRPQRGLDVHVNTGAQSINTESLSKHENKIKQKTVKTRQAKTKGKNRQDPNKACSTMKTYMYD